MIVYICCSLLFYSFSSAVVWVGCPGCPCPGTCPPVGFVTCPLCLCSQPLPLFHKATNRKVTVCSSDRVAFFVLCLNWFQNQPAVSSTWHFTSSSHTGHCCGYLTPAVGARAQVSTGRALWPMPSAAELSLSPETAPGTLELVSAACAAGQHWEDPGR